MIISASPAPTESLVGTPPQFHTGTQGGAVGNSRHLTLLVLSSQEPHCLSTNLLFLSAFSAAIYFWRRYVSKSLPTRFWPFFCSPAFLPIVAFTLALLHCRAICTVLKPYCCYLLPTSSVDFSIHIAPSVHTTICSQ